MVNVWYVAIQQHLLHNWYEAKISYKSSKKMSPLPVNSLNFEFYDEIKREQKWNRHVIHKKAKLLQLIILTVTISAILCD